MVEAGADYSGWASVGAIVGTVAVAAWAVIKGRIGEASPAITQTRAEATEVFVKETTANREALNALREILVAEKDLMTTMRDALGRLVTVQEDIARMMHEQREDEMFVLRTNRLLNQISERERRVDPGQARRIPE